MMPRPPTRFLTLVTEQRAETAHAQLTNQSRRVRNGLTGDGHPPTYAPIPTARFRFNLGNRVRHPSDGAHGPARVTYARDDPTEGSIDV